MQGSNAVGSRGKRLVAGLVALSVADVALANQYSKMSVPVADPASWISPDDYPIDALRAGKEGVVRADIGVDTSGSVVSCVVTASSETPSLDAKTCELAMQRGAFVPAIGENNRPIASVYRFAVRWVLPKPRVEEVSVDISDAGTETTVSFDVTVDQYGAGISCRPVGQVTPGADPCAAFVPGMKNGVRYVRGGTPVSVVIHQRRSTVVEVLDR